MPIYTPWTWSQAHGRHYAYILADDAHTVLDTLWSRPPVAAPPTGAAISDLSVFALGSAHFTMIDTL